MNVRWSDRGTVDPESRIGLSVTCVEQKGLWTRFVERTGPETRGPSSSIPPGDNFSIVFWTPGGREKKILFLIFFLS